MDSNVIDMTHRRYRVKRKKKKRKEIYGQLLRGKRGVENDERRRRSSPRNAISVPRTVARYDRSCGQKRLKRQKKKKKREGATKRKKPYRGFSRTSGWRRSPVPPEGEGRVGQRKERGRGRGEGEIRTSAASGEKLAC